MLEALAGNVPLLLLSVGLVLMALEAISPGANFVVVGVALVGAGLLGVFLPITSPFILAGLALGIGLVAAYVYHEFDFYGGKGTAQTKDSSSLAGTTGYATRTITNRDGEVKLDEGGFAPYYSARTSGDPIEEGEEIIVLDPGGGNVLTVESLDTIAEDEIDRALAREAEARADRDETDTDANLNADVSDDAGADSRPLDDRERETEPSD